MIWRYLEVLELSRIGMDAATIRPVLGALPNLHALKITDMQDLDDSFFQINPGLPPFPALAELLLEETPLITARGILTYLSTSMTYSALRSLSLVTTGVLPSTIFEI